MVQRALEHHVQDLERRVATVEQILPTLATKTDLADLQAATKADLADIRMIAEGVVSLHARVDAHHAQTTGVLAEHDRRLTRLETSRPKRR